MVRFTAAAVAVAAVLLPGVASADSIAAGNRLQNPSLESASGITPTCWSLGGSGNNTYVWTHTTDAHSGSYAEKLTIKSWSSGRRELVTAGACAPTVTPGHTYGLSAWYKVPSGSPGAPALVAYYRNSSGNWVKWAQSSAFASHSVWTHASWTTPLVPSGVHTIRVAMELTHAGSVTMDDFSLLDLPTVPSSERGSPPAGIPRPDATCAAVVTPTGEKRPSNTTANNTVPADPSAIQWNPAYSSWPAFVSDRNDVTGGFKGTTDEILQWAACKWGLDVNIARADAWLESGWYQSTRSGCSTPDEASFGLFQIVSKDCAGNLVHGGWPYVQDDTALNADYWGAWIRACFDGAFNVSNHPWQTSPAQGYGGQSMAQVIAQHGEDYALWGCIGAWFSNAWYSSAAQWYISTVQKDYAAKPWLQPGT